MTELHTKKVVALSFTEGRVVRDLFENGFLEMLEDLGVEVVLFTPAEKVPSFKESWLPRVKAIEFHPLYKISSKEQRLFNIRSKFISKYSGWLKKWIKIEKVLYDSDIYIESLLKKYDCKLVILTHPTHSFELPLYKAAVKLSITTIGILRSWDNIHKGLRIRPDYLTVWNNINKQEAIDLIKFTPDQVYITGGSQFDGYFSKNVRENTRAEFCSKHNLALNRPIIMMATLGAFIHLYDEQYLVDFLIQRIIDGTIPDSPQLIIRLHPTSRLEYMLKYLEYDFVRLSYIKEYIPSIGWTMTRAEVEEVGCILKHSDVVISPGSTITIETAIFDTPTIVPVFHLYQPDSGIEVFQYHFATHFRKLRDENLVPIVENKEDLIKEISKCLNDQNYYSLQREQLAKDYIHYFDGGSTRRIAEFIFDKIQTR